MNNTRMLQIARDIASSLEHMLEQNVIEYDAKKAIEARKLAITPDAGWEGKNAEQRELVALKTFAADEILTALSITLHQAQLEMSNIAWRVDALRDERRAIEWGIKQDLVNVLAYRSVPVEETGGEFEAVADQTVEQEIWTAISGNSGPAWDMTGMTEDEAPF